MCLRIPDRTQQPQPNEVVGGSHREELSEVGVLRSADELLDDKIMRSGGPVRSPCSSLDGRLTEQPKIVAPMTSQSWS
jgi:hypothetical protein